MDTFKIPRPQESLKCYVSRIRKNLGMTQFELADAAGIHGRSVGKIERGLTVKINRKTLQGLAIALGIIKPAHFWLSRWGLLCPAPLI